MVVGFTGGSIPEVKVNRLLLNNTEVIGAGWGAYVIAKPELNREIGAEIDRLAEAGFVKPIVGARYPAGADRGGAEADRRPRGDRQGRAGAEVAGYSIPSGPRASPERNCRTNWFGELNSSLAGPDSTIRPFHSTAM